MTSKVTELHSPCPACSSSDAFCRYEDGHGFCFSCKAYFPPNNKDFELDTYTYEYLPLRGISKESLAFYDCKTKIDPEGKPIEIGFKYPNGAYKVRALDKKTFRTEGEINKAGLFGRNKFAAGSHRYITITEGELDAISLYQVLRNPVVSVQSSATAVRDCAGDIDYLRSFDRVYLAFDADGPGREAAANVAKLFDYNRLYDVKFSNRKDANEYLQAGESQELLNIWQNAKKYLPDAIRSSLSDFKKVLSEPARWGVPYPFETLTNMTYGIRRGESVLLTAQEGVGKTELMHAIEYKLLKETKDNVAAIFLEEPEKRHLQALAGLELQKPVHLPDCGLTASEISGALENVIGVDDRLHIYSHFGSDNPDTLLDSIRFLVSGRNCFYVLLDHITMATSGSGSDDERRVLDYLSTRLEMMVKELNFALIVVSHVNDEGLTRGSRYISKIADIRIDATRNVTAANPIERNRTYLTISKNRYAGKTGPAGEIIFDPNTYSMTEAPTFVAANDNEVQQEAAA